MEAGSTSDSLILYYPSPGLRVLEKKGKKRREHSTSAGRWKDVGATWHEREWRERARERESARQREAERERALQREGEIDRQTEPGRKREIDR